MRNLQVISRTSLWGALGLTLLTLQAMAQTNLTPDAPEVMAELSKRSQIPESELRDILTDCESTQMAMNLCAFQQAVWAELLLDAAIADGDAMTPAAYADWKSGVDARCLAETSDHEGGSIRAMLILNCKETVMLAERRLILGTDHFPDPPNDPPHPKGATQ